MKYKLSAALALAVGFLTLATGVSAQTCFGPTPNPSCAPISNPVANLTSATGVLFSNTSMRAVSNTTAETSAVPTSGVGSMTIPANWATPGRKIRVHVEASYQTPTLPGSVTVKVKLGSTVLAQTLVDANILATGSNTRELFGWANITFLTAGSTAQVVCNGTLAFNVGGTLTWRTFSTAESFGSPTAVRTIDTTQPLLVDVTETWTTANASQGTTTVQTTLESIN